MGFLPGLMRGWMGPTARTPAATLAMPHQMCERFLNRSRLRGCCGGGAWRTPRTVVRRLMRATCRVARCGCAHEPVVLRERANFGSWAGGHFISCGLPYQSMPAMQRIRIQESIRYLWSGRRRGVGAPARAVPAAVAAAGAAWQRRCRRCNRCRRCISIRFAACVVLVCCAGKDCYGSHLHPRLHLHSSSSGFQDDSVQRGAVAGCTLRHSGSWTSNHHRERHS